MRLTQPLFEVFGHAVSGRDLILLTGGLFLLYKATHEIHQKLEGEDPNTSATEGVSSFASVIVQIMLLDIVFSIDSVVTAVGLAEDLAVMVIAVLISGVIMIISANPVSQFVGDHPTVRMLALAFLLLIGMALVAEGMGQHIPKGYIYFAMGFSVLVEVLNLKAKPRQGPVLLRGSMMFDTKKL
jgi:predicted tellurium resistance membrane protein TerC